MLVTQSHCSLTPHFGPFLSEEKTNRKKRNFFSATIQGLSPLTLLTLKMVISISLAHSQRLLSILFVSSEVLQSARP